MQLRMLHKNKGLKINIFTRDVFTANEILLSTKLVSVCAATPATMTENKIK